TQSGSVSFARRLAGCAGLRLSAGGRFILVSSGSPHSPFGPHQLHRDKDCLDTAGAGWSCTAFVVDHASSTGRYGAGTRSGAGVVRSDRGSEQEAEWSKGASRPRI